MQIVGNTTDICCGHPFQYGLDRLVEAIFNSLLERLQRVSGKKQGKLMRQSSRLYDRIVVGPDRLPPAMNMDHTNGPAVSPHWRRGHFRMQAHGPHNSLRKLMFIAPVLVAAERLSGEREAPAPKRYGVATR